MRSPWLMDNLNIARFVGRPSGRFALMLAMLVTLALSPSVRAAVWLNIAQVQRLKGRDEQAIKPFSRSLALDPDNVHLRWQTAAAQAEAGNGDAAAATLLPLVNHRSLDPNLAKLMLTVLTASEYKDEALHFYQNLENKNLVTSGMAARVADAYLVRSAQIPPVVIRPLLAQVFGLEPARRAFQTFEKQFTLPGFWSTEFGQKLRTALAWRNQPLSRGHPIKRSSHGDTQRVAAMLGVAPSSLHLGSELVRNGSFEKHDVIHDTPAGWRPYPTFETMGDMNIAAFVIGTDRDGAYQGTHSLRIDGLHVERLAVKGPARAAFGHAPIAVDEGTPYVISFVYRTERASDPAAALQVSFDPQLLFAHDLPLSETQGRWRRVIIIAWNRSGKDATVAPLLSSLTDGSVWFDDLSIRPIALSRSIPPRDPLVEVEDVGNN